MQSPALGPRDVVYENRYQRIYRVKAQFDGFAKEFFVNDYGRRVGLLLVRGDEVLLVRQYRLLVDGPAWEIPGGRVDEGESPADAARREGLEESGYRCHTVSPLLCFHPGLDTFENPTFLFFSTDFEPEPGHVFHPDEVQERVWKPLEECLRMIFTGELVDSLSIAALFALQVRRSRPELVP